MNYKRLYEYRFKSIDQKKRQIVWNEIAKYVYNQLGRPACILDPASGRGEFISAIPAKERWAVDEIAYYREGLLNGVIFIESNILNIDLKNEYFDGIFVR